MRGIRKVTFLRSLDVTRAAARRIGDLLEQRGIIEDPEDVMYLTAEEISDRIPTNAQQLVADRKAERTRYLGFKLPSLWQGEPEPIETAGTGKQSEADVLTGIASATEWSRERSAW